MTLVNEPKGDADPREAVHEVGRSIWVGVSFDVTVHGECILTNGIDTECWLVSPVRARPSSVRLFSDAMSRVSSIVFAIEVTYNLKVGYASAMRFLTSSSTLTSNSVTRSTEFFFSSTLEPVLWIASEPARITFPASYARETVKSRIDCRSSSSDMVRWREFAIAPFVFDLTTRKLTNVCTSCARSFPNPTLDGIKSVEKQS